MPAMVCTALLSAAFAMLAVRPRNRAAAKMPIELRMVILLGIQPNNRTYTPPALRGNPRRSKDLLGAKFLI
jgi:hypothetical protein